MVLIQKKIRLSLGIFKILKLKYILKADLLKIMLILVNFLVVYTGRKKLRFLYGQFMFDYSVMNQLFLTGTHLNLMSPIFGLWSSNHLYATFSLHPTLRGSFQSNLTCLSVFPVCHKEFLII